MSIAAGLIAEDLVVGTFRTVMINGKAYTLRPATYSILARRIRHLRHVKLEEAYTKISILRGVEQGEHIINALSYLLAKNRFSRFLIRRKLKRATFAELKDAYYAFVEVAGGQDFFELASLVMSISRMAARPK